MRSSLPLLAAVLLACACSSSAPSSSGGDDAGDTAPDAACPNPCGGACCGPEEQCNPSTHACQRPCKASCDGKVCGNDGCGGSCGSCAKGLICSGLGKCETCVPATCAGLKRSCGKVPDGCGGTLDCGGCSAPQTCGGGSDPNACGCTPLTCDAGKSCGTLSDGCGGRINCGNCPTGSYCGSGAQANTCVTGQCPPETDRDFCVRLGSDCGTVVDFDNCGNSRSVNCGVCAAGKTCGVQAPNVCGDDCRKAPCTGLTWCDTNTGRCLPGCTSTAQCGASETCDTANHACVCNAGTHRCGGACAQDSSPSSCGTSCTPCPTPANATATCSAGRCGFTCKTGFHACNGQCVSNSATATCGASCSPCTVPANATATCNGTACGYVCSPGYHDCGGVCVKSDSVNSCGTRCTACPSANGTAACVNGACTIACTSGFHACSGQCLSNTSISSCGTSCSPCTPPANATATCNGTACDFTCNSGYHRCGSLCLSNTDPGSCGMSCTACAAPANANATCSSGTCGFACRTGYHLCNGACVSNTSTGSCGTSCTPCTAPSNANATCDGTSCGFSCKSGFHDCSGTCSANTSVNSCGTSSCTPCVPPANANATCDGTKCGYTCRTGYHLCGTDCVPDTPFVCSGGCSPCLAPGANEKATCTAGVCGRSCISTCNGACVNTDRDDNNCGVCGKVCGAGTHCSAGSCAASCANGWGVAGLSPAVLAGTKTEAHAVADFNNDGKPDLALANMNDGKIYVALGTGGFGFGTPTEVIAKSPAGIAAADFNGDGKVDFAVTSYDYNGALNVFTGDGKGGFTGSWGTYPGPGPQSIVAADLNNDARPDLVVAVTGAYSSYVGDEHVDVYVNNGDGTFTRRAQLGAREPHGLVTADFDNDGDLDIAVSSFTASNTDYINVYANNLVNGVPSFPTSSSYPCTWPEGMTAADVNGDTLPDLLVGNSYPGVAWVLLNNQGGVKGKFSSPLNLKGTGDGLSPAVVDLNGDGKLDLVTVGNGVVNTFTGNGAGGFTAASVFGAGAGSYVAPYDFNGDGRLDLSFSLGVGGVSFMPNAASGLTLPISLDTSGAPFSVAAGDLNGDGRPDLVTTGLNDSLDVFVNNGGLNFAGKASYMTGKGARVALVGDVNGDGLLDVATVNHGDYFGSNSSATIFPGAGNGTLLTANTILAGWNEEGGAIADLDRDGKADIIAAGFGDTYGFNATLFVLPGGSTTATSFGLPGSSLGVVAGDLDLDGRPDLVTTDPQNAHVLMNTDGFTFKTADNGRSSGPGAVAIGDLNNDRHPDVVTVGYRYLEVSYGAANGQFTATQIPVNTLPVAHAVQVADLNGDGNQDIVLLHQTSAVLTVLFGTGNGYTFTAQSYAVGGLIDTQSLNARDGGVSALKVQDLDGDGLLDVAVANSALNKLTVLKGVCR